MKVGVFGAGYVGLVAGTCLADSGHRVTIVDVDAGRVAALSGGRIPIYEPGLSEPLQRSVREGRLHFTTQAPAAVAGADVVFIAVGTPQAPDGSADLSYVLQAARAIAEALTGYAVVVVKSTVPVGTHGRVREAIAALTDQPFDVASNPEFLKEGSAVDDFMRPDRVVIGATSDRACQVLDELYAPFVRTGAPVLHVSPASAELGKYAANGMLAVRISFMNEIAALCAAEGADVSEVRHIVGADKRIGSAFLFPGLGYGGSCFPKDISALVKAARANGLETPLIAGADVTNRRQKTVLMSAVHAHFGEDLTGLRFAIWGLAFKPRTDDMREAPSANMIAALRAAGAAVRAYDPEAIETARRILGDGIEYAGSALEALDGADALIMVTEWNEFRSPDFDEMARRLKQKVVFDGRNVYQPEIMRRHGFHYYSIGRRPVRPEDDQE